MAQFLTTLIVAGWVGAIALISVQNAAPISLQFLFFETIQLPIGLVLGLSTVAGMVGAAAVIPILKSSRSIRSLGDRD